ncbi:hypothetical protein RJ640_023394 [Escallonia rubra]|uniref:J domain-containing protein n=1 Tax=Escallonia rubra TaxID=112253 RepID=A0AA88UNS7_9ASTE|nr:hypothetical protein RJ640_023394 [Escallonia rubra]
MPYNMALLGKRCQYKRHPNKLAQFGVSPATFQELGGDCTADEIRSAYRRLALQRHSDKLAQFCVSPAAFQELAAAYKVFSEPRERVDWLLL